ncbi:hypothetical protein PMAYCL1PPCAC_24247, partial [Pristionchus mayeri]
NHPLNGVGGRSSIPLCQRVGSECNPLCSCEKERRDEEHESSRFFQFSLRRMRRLVLLVSVRVEIVDHGKRGNRLSWFDEEGIHSEDQRRERFTGRVSPMVVLDEFRDENIEERSNRVHSHTIHKHEEHDHVGGRAHEIENTRCNHRKQERGMGDSVCSHSDDHSCRQNGYYLGSESATCIEDRQRDRSLRQDTRRNEQFRCDGCKVEMHD